MRYIKKLQNKINIKNRSMLTNLNPTIISSNCAGGILSHWLGLEHRSPFVNLFMSNDDFIMALENFEKFIATEIHQDMNASVQYPVGVGYNGIKIYFMHYSSFEEAMNAWNRRKRRIDRNNMGIMMCNWNGEKDVLTRFDRLPFNCKVVFVDEPHPEVASAFYLRGFKMRKKINGFRGGSIKNIWRTQNYISGKRYIDQFDYVGFINNLH